MRGNGAEQNGPRTEALRRALQQVHDEAAAADLLFLEFWQIAAACPTSPRACAPARSAEPIRRLAAEIHAELTRR